MLAIALCNRTPNALLPWARAGYECIAYDLQHTGHERGADGIWRIKADVRSLHRGACKGAAIVMTFPPCTHTAVSGARWFASKGLPPLIEALEIIEACRSQGEESGAAWFLEQPTSVTPSHMGRWSYWFQPNEYGGYAGGENDGYTKATFLWCGNGFVMPEKRPIPLAVDHDRIHKMPPSEDRADKRSETPMGFAQAVFEANAKLVQREAA